MRKILLAALLLFSGIGIGIGALYGFSNLWNPAAVLAAAPVNVQPPSSQQAQSGTPTTTVTQAPALPNQGWNNNGWRMGPGMMGVRGNNPGQGYWGMGSGMMGRGMMGNWGGSATTGQRLTINQAIDTAKNYVASSGQGLMVAEIMEFNNNFYVSVKEIATGRGAFELLVDPYSGAVMPEMGPNMMWNARYGHMGNGQPIENNLTIDQAVQQGQKYLDSNLHGAQLQADGASFYGYYTFDYKVNDQVAGMLSVNGIDGSVWLHTWHGQFIAEQEVK